MRAGQSLVSEGWSVQVCGANPVTRWSVIQQWTAVCGAGQSEEEGIPRGGSLCTLTVTQQVMEVVHTRREPSCQVHYDHGDSNTKESQ